MEARAAIFEAIQNHVFYGVEWDDRELEEEIQKQMDRITKALKLPKTKLTRA